MGLIFLIASTTTLSCDKQKNSLHDGFFTAEADSFEMDNWKNYLTIYVNNGQITIVEFDAFDQSGFRRSWDMDYLLEANTKHGAKATQCYLAYQSALLTLQDASRIQPVAGAKRMHQIFTTLAAKVISNSMADDKSIAYVKLPENAFPGDL